MLDLAISKPDAQGGIGPLFAFPAMSVFSAVASVAAVGVIKFVAGLLHAREPTR